MQTQSTDLPDSEINPASQSGERKPIIAVRDVCKSFGKARPTVKNLNFEVQHSEIFCLLGPSGSGKSTTMRMLTGVYRPTSGYMEVLGREPYRFNRQTRSRMGYMPQQFVLFPELTTLENINFVAAAYAMSFFGRARKVREALEFVDLWEARNFLASQLSGGMRRRLELAATLVHGPELIFVDEPTAGIDPILRAKFWEHFKQLSKQGNTLFVTTQYVTEADYCDKVAILNRGRLLALGTPEEVRRQSLGGAIINLRLEEVTTHAMRLLRGIKGMLDVHLLPDDKLKLTVEDASLALREIVGTLEQNGIPILTIEPYRPDFEEVFVRLMEQDNKTLPEDEVGPDDEADLTDQSEATSQLPKARPE